MANALYDNAKASLKLGFISWLDDSFAVALVNTGLDYGYQVLPSDIRLSDIPRSAIVATAPLENTAIIDGAASADDVCFKYVTSSIKGEVVSAMVIYKDTGDVETSTLVAYIDTVFGSFPLVPNGGDITISWGIGPNKIFFIGHDGLDTITKSEVIQ